MTQDEAYAEYQEETGILLQKFHCNCSQILAVRRKIADGRIVVYEQCQRCGKSPKSLKKADFDVDSLPWFNENLAEAYQQERDAAFCAARTKWMDNLEIIRQEQEAQKAEESEAWWEKYSEYLHSQQWYDMRNRVLNRDQNICQACLRNKATQVHHLSYAIYNTIGRSAAFELIAICYHCHKLIHPHMAEAQHNLTENLHNPYLNGGRNGHN